MTRLDQIASWPPEKRDYLDRLLTAATKAREDVEQRGAEMVASRPVTDRSEGERKADAFNQAARRLTDLTEEIKRLLSD